MAATRDGDEILDKKNHDFEWEKWEIFFSNPK
jgi:hypothetical protein